MSVNIQNKPIVVGTPVEIDDAVNKLRLDLSNIPWVTHPYFIAQRFYREQNGKKYLYPETYCVEPDVKNKRLPYHRLTPDNDYSGMFFAMVGPGRYDSNQFNSNTQGHVDYKVGFIFSVNLRLIDEVKLNQGLFTRELMRDVRRVLKAKVFSYDFSYTLESEHTDLQEVYQEFILEDLEQYNRAPMQCFRFNLDIKVLEDCE